MIWELDALKILARNETVPGVALRDAISEIDRLNKKLGEFAEAVGMMATLNTGMKMDMNHPVKMAKKVCAYVLEERRRNVELIEQLENKGFEESGV